MTSALVILAVWEVTPSCESVCGMDVLLIVDHCFNVILITTLLFYTAIGPFYKPLYITYENEAYYHIYGMRWVTKFDLILTWVGKPNNKNFFLSCSMHSSAWLNLCLFILKLSYSLFHIRTFFEHSNSLDDTCSITPEINLIKTMSVDITSWHSDNCLIGTIFFSTPWCAI